MDILYVYYRLLPADARRARDAVRELQSHVCRDFAGVRTRLMCKNDVAERDVTWLEVYEPAPLGLEAHLADLVARTELPALAGARRLERFSET